MSPQTSIDFMVTPDMTAAERSVWFVIRNHEGAARAIKAEDVSTLSGLSVRNVQRAIHELIHRHRKPIGGSMSAPYGYYLAVTPEERAEAARLYRDRAKGMLATAAVSEGISAEEYLRRYQTELGAA